MIQTMTDLHTHTYLSDGALGPAEHIRRAQTKGYRILGLADHADLATLDRVVPVLVEAARRENEVGQMIVLAGIELTHVRPAHVAEGIARARQLGAQYVIVHGETIVEPVDEGTNAAAIEAGADILAHPGLISSELVAKAAQRGVRLEISGKAGHSLSNGHVARLAVEAGVKLIYGSDAHEPGQMHGPELAEKICLAAGLDAARVQRMFADAADWAKRLANDEF
jgi:histidinol phosphatase-like PHP family hydrolase